MDPLYCEKDLAQRLQIGRDDIKFLRANALLKEKDWRRLGRDVVLTESGVGKLLQATVGAAVVLVDLTGCLVKNGALPGDGLTELVVRRTYPNRRLLQATNPATGQVVNVRVSNNENFLPRMPPPKARLTATGTYEMVGRCPRKGRGKY